MASRPLFRLPASSTSRTSSSARTPRTCGHAPGRRGLAEPALEVRIEEERRVAAEPEEQDVPDEGREDLQDAGRTPPGRPWARRRTAPGTGWTGRPTTRASKRPQASSLRALDLVPVELQGPLEVAADEEGEDAGLLRAEVPLEQDLLDLLAADGREGQGLAARADGREEAEGARRHQDDVGEGGRLLEDLEQGVGGRASFIFSASSMMKTRRLPDHRPEVGHLLEEVGLLDLDASGPRR